MLEALEPYEVRDPIHGFIRLNQIEWDVINQPVFQRLRRIRQLAWTDMVYPGAMHTRFEHSLGVMHVASQLFDALKRRSREILRSDYDYTDEGLARQRLIIRLAALLHDLGHGPFSHAAEEVFPINPKDNKQYSHEDYSEAILKYGLVTAIENHPQAKNMGIRASDVLGIFASAAPTARELVWKDLVSGQMDADRMDYLLRDAYHAGVQYGHYDLGRVVNTLRLCADHETGGHYIGVEEDGVHAVEGLLIARFMMFTQLYFHKTRTIYDYHLTEALKELLKDSNHEFPPPTNIAEYLQWDDWRVLGAIAAGAGGIHGNILRDRDHFRLVFTTAEMMTDDEAERARDIEAELAQIGCVSRDAEKSWYKSGPDEIKVWRTSAGPARSVPLATLSPVVRGLTKVNQRRLYVPLKNRDEARKIIIKKLEKAP